MSSIVLELQQELIKSDCDIIAALRKAHLIASKLQLNDFDAWIQAELNGYGDIEDSIPDYREVFGSLKGYNPMRGWIPVVITSSKFENIVCRRKLGMSISEVIELCRNPDGLFAVTFTADASREIGKRCSAPFQTEYALHISKHYLKGIKEKVVNRLMEWTLKLEAEGILGEEMRFNTEEKAAAKEMSQTINNYYGNTSVINGSVDHSSVVSGDNTAVSFTYEAAQAAMDEIKASLVNENIAQDDKDSAIEMLAEINDKIANQKKPSMIKAALIGLKDFLIGVGASATVALVQAKLQGLF